jgi:hypothetical protein
MDVHLDHLSGLASGSTLESDDPEIALERFTSRGLSLDDVATVVGWKKGKVEQIAARYVTAEEIGLAMVQKLQRNMLETESIKGAVKGPIGAA